MGHALTVRVLDRENRPVSRVKVKIRIDGIMSGGWLSEVTDRSGYAEFVTAGEYESHRKLEIYVRGQSFGPYRIGGRSYTVTLT